MASIQNLLSSRKQGSSVAWEMWPFKKNLMAGLQKYDPPVLLRPGDSKDVYGFSGDLYCPECGEKSDFMLIEFRKPSAEMMAALINIDLNEIDEDLLRCPKCGRTDLKPI